MAITDAQRDELLSRTDGRPYMIESVRAANGGDAFRVALRERTVATAHGELTDEVVLTLSFPLGFPQEPPEVVLRGGRIFHPNFTDDGHWCGAALKEGETLSDYLARLADTVGYREVDRTCLGNRNAMAWYHEHEREGDLPIVVPQSGEKPRIVIFRADRPEDDRKGTRIEIREVHHG